MKILSFSAETSTRFAPIDRGVICFFKTVYRGETLTTFVGARTIVEAEAEGERRLRELISTGNGDWYRLTDREIDEAIAAFSGGNVQ